MNNNQNFNVIEPEALTQDFIKKIESGLEVNFLEEFDESFAETTF